MGTVHPCITPPVAEWIRRQHMFTVATAPLGADGHVNVSPKGFDSLRVVDELTVAYLDYTGSGAETIAHLRENGRITLMWSAFEGPPRIVRVHGHGEVLGLDDPRVAGLFDVGPGARAVIWVQADRVSDSCGYSVPLYEYVGERTKLIEWAEAKGPDGVAEYWLAKNATSIDGLPALSD
ncbi:MAG: pyridoxamine 5'-phosphate oxidase family protein [Ilumatobacteraceae bacterium]